MELRLDAVTISEMENDPTVFKILLHARLRAAGFDVTKPYDVQPDLFDRSMTYSQGGATDDQRE